MDKEIKTQVSDLIQGIANKEELLVKDNLLIMGYSFSSKEVFYDFLSKRVTRTSQIKWNKTMAGYYLDKDTPEERLIAKTVLEWTTELGSNLSQITWKEI